MVDNVPEVSEQLRRDRSESRPELGSDALKLCPDFYVSDLHGPWQNCNACRQLVTRRKRLFGEDLLD